MSSETGKRVSGLNPSCSPELSARKWGRRGSKIARRLKLGIQHAGLLEITELGYREP
jgi:hypothetical protein